MNRKVAMRAAGAVAAAVGIQSAKGALIVTNLNADVPNKGFSDVDVNGDANRDFSVANNSDGVWLKNSAANAKYAATTGTDGTVSPITGSTVGPGLAYVAPANTVYLINTATPTSTPYPMDGSTQYVGFQLDAGGGNFNYGALSLTIVPSGDDGVYKTHLGSIYYETTPNVAAVLPSVPEPGSLAALAMGAAGVLLRRRSH